MLTHIANAAIAAYQAELRQGVELPEDIEAWIEPMTSDELKAAIQQYAAACAAQARLRALEDAKRVCEAEFTVEGIAQRCAAAIEKLKGGE